MVQAKAEDLSKKLPTGAAGMPTGGYALPPPPDEPKPVDKKPPEKEPPPSPPKGGDYRETFRKAMLARDKRQWPEVRRLLTEAIALNGTESTERITISGFGNTEQYLPKYFLGVALRNLGDCPGALNAFAQSEKDGAIQRTGQLRTLQRERDACGK